MTLLGHKTDIMFRKYIQRQDERLIEAVAALAECRATKLAKGEKRNHNVHKSFAERAVLATLKSAKR